MKLEISPMDNFRVTTNSGVNKFETFVNVNCQGHEGSRIIGVQFSELFYHVFKKKDRDIKCFTFFDEKESEGYDYGYFSDAETILILDGHSKK